MSDEIVFILEPDAGRVTVEASQAPLETVRNLEKDLGERVNVNCARPADSERAEISQPIIARGLYLYRLYHYSTVDGPGRRSVVQVSGCSIRCPGCYVPDTHEQKNGVQMPIVKIISEIVSLRSEHDGVTVLGGEPFDQPEAVAELVTRLKAKDFHVTVYTGYLLKKLINRKEFWVDQILLNTDLLIEGPYVRELGSSAGEYRGSRNQGLISRPLETRRALSEGNNHLRKI